MFTIRFSLRLFVLFVVVFVASTLVQGQATRTWVSGVGDDVNPCSRTAPCKTFAGAISKTATNGEINCLDPAGYGAVTVTKSITIDCEDTQGSILASLVNGIIVNITSATDTRKAVRIRGISINGAATGINGIRIVAAASVSVEDVVIAGFTASGISIEGATQVAVRNSSIRGALTGISGAPAAGNVDILVSGSMLAFNGTGLNAGPNATIRVAGSTIAYNTTGLGAGRGTIVSFGNNAIDGNATNGTPTSSVQLR